MPTLLQRIHVLAAGDSERERSWRTARKFALATYDNQVVHVEGQEQRIPSTTTCQFKHLSGDPPSYEQQGGLRQEISSLYGAGGPGNKEWTTMGGTPPARLARPGGGEVGDHEFNTHDL